MFMILIGSVYVDWWKDTDIVGITLDAVCKTLIGYFHGGESSPGTFKTYCHIV